IANPKQENDPANLTEQAIGTRFLLQQLQDYLDGSADPETAARVEAELKDPDNIYIRAMRALREHRPEGRFEAFEEFIRGINAETDARIDAKVNDPNWAPPPVEWLDDTDPLGMNWEWAEPPKEKEDNK